MWNANKPNADDPEGVVGKPGQQKRAVSKGNQIK